MARRYRTSEDMYSLIHQWELSDTDITSFCKEHSLSSQVFYYWRKKYQSEQVFTTLFTEIRQGETLGSTPSILQRNTPCKITYPNGVVLELDSSTPVSQLKTLLTYHV